MEVFLAGCPSSRNIGVIAHNANLFSIMQIYLAGSYSRPYCLIDWYAEGRKEGNAIIFSGGGIG